MMTTSVLGFSAWITGSRRAERLALLAGRDGPVMTKWKDMPAE
jgi:hypothetical protein